MRQRLYRIVLQNFKEFYVISGDPTSAYEQLLNNLETWDWYFSIEREMSAIHLVAEHSQYADCGCVLIMERTP